MQKTILRTAIDMSRNAILGLIMCCFFGQLVLAESSSAQSIEDVFVLANTEHNLVESIFDDIESATTFSFLYNKRRIETMPHRISLSDQEYSVADILRAIAEETGLQFRQINKTITVKAFDIIPLKEEQADGATIKGTVYDANTEETLPATNVFLEGTNKGVTTDVNGGYEIQNVEPGAYTLVVRFIGYQVFKQEIEVSEGETLTIDIALEEDLVDLDEIVVTGYSTRKRSMPTGALVRLDNSDFQEALIQSPDQAIQGKVSGVHVTHSSGQPGSGLQVRVRGLGSINASNSPLYIVDGVQVQTMTSDIVPSNALASINPDDIESIEVLKDASSTALYGAQGANGVVLITTKQARKGQTEINVSSQLGFNEQPEKIDKMDGPTWTETMIQGYVNYYTDRGEDPAVRRQMAIDKFGDPATAPTYDWQEALTRAGALRKINVSASTGLENTRIFLSGAYNYEEGPVLASDFNSLRFRSNIDHSFSDKFTVASRLGVSSTVSNGLVAGSAYINSPFHGGYTTRPIDAIYTDDGDYNQNDIIRINLVQLLNENIREATTRQLRGSLSGTYRFTDKLSFRTLWGLDYRTVRDRAYTSALLPRYEDRGGTLSERYKETMSLNTNQIIEYGENFQNHNINLIGGFEYRVNDRESIQASGEQFPNPIFSQLDLAAAEFAVSGRTSQSKFAGFLGRANYNYKNKYFVSGNIRYDGSSRFGQENQWGLFYSGALAWELAEEQFIKDISFINKLKLKTSYGVTGNSGIGNFAARSLFGSGGDPYEGNIGLRPSNLGNDLLTWEEAHSFDLGFEFSVLENRIYGDVNWFNTRNENLLLNAWLPTDSGFSSITKNSGVVENRGIELELGARWLATKNFSWSTNFNLTYQENEIIELVDGLDILGSSTRVGYPIDIRWDYDFAGINPADGRPFWYDKDGNITYRRNSEDKTMVGKYSPDYFGGLTNTFSYKNISLNIFFQYEYGRSTYNSTVGRRMESVSTEKGLTNRVATHAWQKPGDMAEIPRHYNSKSFPGSSSHYHSSLKIKDASYIRLKEMRLNYSLPVRWIEKLGLNRANVFAQGRNIITWTNYPYGDPEFLGSGTGEYPQSRQFAFGVNIKF